VLPSQLHDLRGDSFGLAPLGVDLVVSEEIELLTLFQQRAHPLCWVYAGKKRSGLALLAALCRGSGKALEIDCEAGSHGRLQLPRLCRPATSWYDHPRVAALGGDHGGAFHLAEACLAYHPEDLTYGHPHLAHQQPIDVDEWSPQAFRYQPPYRALPGPGKSYQQDVAGHQLSGMFGAEAQREPSAAT
jgi:hypothetical protein